jgi:hypothetical protein
VKKAVLVFRGCPEAPVRNAAGELSAQINAKGWHVSTGKFWEGIGEGESLLVIGRNDEPLIERLLAENQLPNVCGPESLSIHSCNTEGGKKALLVSGGDTAGLMYAVYELADRIRCGGMDALQQEIHLEEHPENRVRGVDRYIMNHLDEEWFFSAAFWDYFLKNLARNRFNRFTLITGFDTPYLTPPYPFFVEVPGFERVRVKNLSAEKRGRNLGMLKEIARKCVENGVLFSFSSWQQKPWTENQEALVENLPEDDDSFTEYCAAGMRLILEQCPDIGAVQLRVNHEAGIRGSGDGVTDTHAAFWNAMTDAIALAGRPVKLDLRAKGVTDGMVAHALSSGLDVSIPTKYWCEHAALPYHISKLRTEEMKNLKNMNASRRYSYGDLLKKPHWYDMIYRLWNYGSINLFLWADPDYCSRFSKSMRMGGGSGFEINSPLSLKGGMEKYAADPWHIHKDASLRTYQWEDERYWAYYLVFGRYGYRSGAGRDLILREFNSRFGAAGEEILKACESASKVLPLITAIHFPVHPSLHYWPELYPGTGLFTENNCLDNRHSKVNYATALPSDEELFYSIADYADDLEAGALKPKYSPLQTRDWLHRIAGEIRSCLEKAGCTENSEGEKLAMWVDFSMIALIADFHTWKSAAAWFLYLYQKNRDISRLAEAYKAMLNGGLKWRELSSLGDRYYCEDLQFNAGTGMARNKNWRYRLVMEVDKDIGSLEALLREAGEEPERYKQNLSGAYYHLAEPSRLKISAGLPESWNGSRDLLVKARVEAAEDLKGLFLNYRHTDHTEGEYKRVPMRGNGEEYEAAVPAPYFAQGYDVIAYLSAIDRNGSAVIFPGIGHPEYPAPYFVVKAGQADQRAL